LTIGGERGKKKEEGGKTPVWCALIALQQKKTEKEKKIARSRRTLFNNKNSEKH